jgi:hypothetical protein
MRPDPNLHPIDSPFHVVPDESHQSLTTESRGRSWGRAYERGRKKSNKKSKETGITRHTMRWPPVPEEEIEQEIKGDGNHMAYHEVATCTASPRAWFEIQLGTQMRRR